MAIFLPPKQMPRSNKPINFIFKKIANLAHNNNNLKQPYKIFFEQTHKFLGEKHILVPTFSSYRSEEHTYELQSP